MNKIRKVISTMLIALSLVGAIVAPLNVTAGSSNESGSLTIHKYQIDDTFIGKPDYEQNGSEIGDEVIGTREDENGDREDVTLSDLAPLEGVRFTIEKVVPKTNDGEIILPLEYELDESFAMETVTVNALGFAYLGGLPLGVYRVTELANEAVEVAAAPFYVSVPHHNESTGWIYDVHVYVKNQVSQPEIHKDVTLLGNQHDTTNVFDEVKWIVTAEIPKDVAKAKEYTVSDHLDKVLQYVDDSLVVSFVDASTGETVILEEEADYMFDLFKNGKTGYPWQDEMHITLTMTGRNKVAGALPVESGEKAWLQIEFNTKIELSDTNLEAILGKEIPNQAELSYINNLNVKFTPKSEIPEVHLGGVQLKKVDAKGVVLSGAKFKIYRSLADAQAKTNALPNPNNGSEDWVAESDASGMAKFFGLAYGEIGQEYNDETAETKYWIVEVEAPKDAQGKSYNLLKDPLEVTVNRVSHQSINAITVVNTKFDLPLTGGEGSTMFIMAGIFLVVAGIGTIVAVKKKKVKA